MPQTARKTSKTRGTKRRSRKAETEPTAPLTFRALDDDEERPLVEQFRDTLRQCGVSQMLAIFFDIVDELKRREVFELPASLVRGSGKDDDVGDRKE
jgi:hypothetical protein